MSATQSWKQRWTGFMGTEKAQWTMLTSLAVEAIEHCHEHNGEYSRIEIMCNDLFDCSNTKFQAVKKLCTQATGLSFTLPVDGATGDDAKVKLEHSKLRLTTRIEEHGEVSAQLVKVRNDGIKSLIAGMYRRKPKAAAKKAAVKDDMDSKMSELLAPMLDDKHEADWITTEALKIAAAARDLAINKNNAYTAQQLLTSAYDKLLAAAATTVLKK